MIWHGTACQYHKYKKGKVIVSDLQNIVKTSFLTFQVFLVSWVSSIFPREKSLGGSDLHPPMWPIPSGQKEVHSWWQDWIHPRWRLVLSDYNAVRARLLNSILTLALTTGECCFCGCPEECGKWNFTVHTVHQKHHCASRVSTSTYTWS